MRKGEEEVLAAIASRFKEKQLGYVLTETEDGYSIQATDGTLRYLVSHQPLGWFMHVEVAEDGVFDLNLSETHPFQEIWDDINAINADYYLDSEEVRAYINKQRLAIQRALFPYTKLIKTCTEKKHQWHYELHEMNGQPASFLITYHAQEKFWDVDLDGFMNEFHFRTELYDLQEAIYTVLDEQNRINIY